MKRNKRYSGLIYKCLTLLVIKRKKSDQRLFLLQDIYCTPLWIKPFPFLLTRQCPPPSHTHSWTVCATQPWSVRHRQPAWSTLLPCSTCLPSNAAVLSAAASVKSFNLLHVFPCTEPSHWQQSNTCKTSKLSSYSQLHEENSIKKSLCSSHLPLWVTGPCRAEAGEGRAARPTVESELSAPRRAALVCQGSFSTDSWTDPPTGCLGLKEARELHPGTWCSGVKKAGFKPGKGIRDKNREGGSSQNKSLKTLHAVKVISSVLYLLNFSSSKTYCKHYCTYLGKRSARNIFNWAARAFPGFANISSSMCIAIKRWRHVVEG